MAQPHLLLSAYQCAPGGGSVSQIGWEWYSRLSKEIAVTLVTHSRNRKILETAGVPLPGSKVIYIDTEWFAGPLHRLASRLFRRSEHAVFLVSSLDFFLYDAVALRSLRKLKPGADLVHAVTPVSPLALTRLHKLGIPLIVGPWNGGIDTLKGFEPVMKSDSEWIHRIRFVRGAFDLLSGCTRKATRILTATAATDRCLPKGVVSERMIENGVDIELFHPDELAPPSAVNPLHVLFVGRLIAAKGIPMLLEAFAQVHTVVPIKLTVVGDGSMRESLEAQVARDRLQDVVTFRGSAAQAEIALLMRRCHVFCLPSIRESGGAVLLEAMASGTPALTVAHGGPGELIDESVGRALPAGNPEALVEGMARSLKEIFQDYAAWRQRGRNGRTRAEQMYSWPGRVQRVVDLYRSVIEERDELSTRGESRRHRARLPSPEHSN